ncbi:hypothetical protein C1701_01595 [Actinoalloteichus sp. AHMU CJ021]|nr:hypothetical protein C1701_01595 [Actinoalloteichus sp. AHMU CJ021]
MGARDGHGELTAAEDTPAACTVREPGVSSATTGRYIGFEIPSTFVAAPGTATMTTRLPRVVSLPTNGPVTVRSGSRARALTARESEHNCFA